MERLVMGGDAAKHV